MPDPKNVRGYLCSEIIQLTSRSLGWKSASRLRQNKVLRCSSCHTIPGIAEANGKVGPPLNAFALRIYIAGQVANTPDNLQHWIMNPHQIDQHTAMPEMGVSDEDSKDIAAYLYTLH